MIKILILCTFFSTAALAEDTVGTKTGKAIDNTIESASEKKQKIQNNLEEALDTLNKDITDLRDKLSQSSENAKAKLHYQLDELETEKNNLNRSMKKLKKSSGQSWEDLKDGLAKSLNELKLAFNKAKKNFQTEEKKK